MSLGRFRDTWQIWLVLLLITLVIIGGSLWGQSRLEPPPARFEQLRETQE